MTAQVAILTSSCAVLAADSAVTVGRERPKVYTGVEKIYPLSDHEPTAALVYGLATLIEVPWGTLLSEYRHRFGALTYSSIEEQAEHLLTFLNGRLADRIEAEGQEMRMARMQGLIAAFRREARECFMESSMKSDSDDDTSGETVLNGVAAFLKEIVALERDAWKKMPRLPGLAAIDEQRLHREHRALLEDIRRRVLAELPLDAATSRAIGDVRCFR